LGRSFYPEVLPVSEHEAEQHDRPRPQMPEFKIRGAKPPFPSLLPVEGERLAHALRRRWVGEPTGTAAQKIEDAMELGKHPTNDVAVLIGEEGAILEALQDLRREAGGLSNRLEKLEAALRKAQNTSA
jgi:hypothetical protein